MAISLLVCILVLLASPASAAIVKHTFNVRNLALQRVCGEQVKTVVNDILPGPAIYVHEGDMLVVHVVNNSPYNITIHWHGVYQKFSNWADGPAYVTQCPVIPGSSYTYRFNVIGQEGTLWWHAHISLLRETVYGAVVIIPRRGMRYPFPKPHKEFPILLGEWWNADLVELAYRGIPRVSDSYTINGQPGDLYKCSANQTHQFDVVRGKTYLLRMVNAVINDHMFFKIAQHSFTVVAVDACYIEPYKTDVIVIAPGQSADVLFTANQPVGNYYMAAHVYFLSPVPFANGTTTAIIHYAGAKSSSAPLIPVLPNFNDSITAHTFYSNLTSLTTNPHWEPVPLDVDDQMFITIGFGLEPCPVNFTCATPFGNGFIFSGNMNNISFQLPTSLSLLEAFQYGVEGIYTDDFPNRPPIQFDYTNMNLSLDFSLLVTEKKETRVKSLKYNSVVDIVLQNIALIFPENHPMHFHGFDFYVLAQGFGNYDPVNDPSKFNLVNPQKRSTIAVPVAGWAAIRFRAINPGVWFVHCHKEIHVPWGLSMAFIIENGPTPATSLPQPPYDLPHC